MSRAGSWIERLFGLTPAFLVAGATWWACGSLVTPYLEREKHDREAIAALHDQMAGAAAASRAIPAFEADAGISRTQIDRLERELPGSTLPQMLPERLTKHFAAFGLTVSAARKTSVQEEVGLPDCKRSYWSIVLTLAESQATLAGALHAVADLEQHQPWVKVLDFAVEPDPRAPTERVAELKVLAWFRE